MATSPRILALLLTLVSADAGAAQFFCAATQSTGFAFRDGEWRATTFHVRDDRFTIARSSIPLGDLEFEVTRLGEQYPSHRCKNTQSPGTKVHLVCGGLGYGFIFSEENLRFQDYYGIGFIDGGDSSRHTPSLTIGTCTKIE